MFQRIVFPLVQLLPLVLCLGSRGRDVLLGRDLSGNLFPSGHVYSTGFTTAKGVAVPGVSKVDLDDNDLNVNMVSKGYTHNIVSMNGKTAWKASYPKGSWNPSNLPKGEHTLNVSTTSGT